MADRNYRLQSLCRSLKHYGGDDVEPDVRVLVDDFLDKLADRFCPEIYRYRNLSRHNSSTSFTTVMSNLRGA